MCDTFATFASHGALFAKNSDRPRNEPQVVRWHAPRRATHELATQYLTIADADACGILISQPTWLWGAEHGVNEHGVAIGNERLWPDRPYDDEPALIGMDLVRLGLERGASADEACEVITDLLGQHGQGGTCDATTNEPYDSSFLVADAFGGWVIETFGSEWVAAPIDRAGAISNRYGIGRDWTRSSTGVSPSFSTLDWHDARVDTRIADHRLRATEACAAANLELDPSVAIATLRDHGSGPWGRPGHEGEAVGDDLSGITVCMHGESLSTTTASMVARLHRRDHDPEVWVCIGSPCTGEYVEVDLDAVSEELAEESRWWEAAAVRDRVESDHLALAAVRADIAPKEAATFGRDLRRARNR